MKAITALPIFRNKFQKSGLYFTNSDFSVGSVIFVPFDKKEKPAVVVEVDELENKKFLIRKNKIKIEKINNEAEISIFKKESIESIKFAETKTDYSVEEIFQKIIPKKTISEINKLTPTSKDVFGIKKFSDKIDLDFLKKKLGKKTRQKREVRGGSEVKTINTILSKIQIDRKSSLHSEKHYLTNEIRTYFGETAKKGKGSFGFYLGFFNRIPERIIYQYWAEAKNTRKSRQAQLKLFWWKIGEYLKKPA